MTNIVPAGHRILVLPQKLEEVDKDIARAAALGLQLVASEHRKEQLAVDRGIVLKVGASAFKDFGGDPWCKEGDLIAYARYGGKTIKQDDVEYLLLNDEDIVCVFTKEQND